MGQVSKPWRIVFYMVVVGAVCFALLLRTKKSEPTFEGRTLSSWLDHHVASSAAVPPYGSEGWQHADRALRAIGTNSIPILLQMLEANNPPSMISKFANRRGWARFTIEACERRREEAEYAFQLLGTNGASAVPELVRIYEKASSPSAQMYAAMSLRDIGRPARAALPSLIQRFNDADQYVRFYAVSAVERIGGEPSIVIPALTRALKDPFVSTRWNALGGLMQYGSRAESVVPEILKMVDDPGTLSGGTAGSISITQQVQTALWRLAPEKVGRPILVEANTPAVNGNKVVQPVMAAFMGERKVLIPAGKNAPAHAQYWDSDPRRGLDLYRRTESGQDHFLGHFEVLNIPDSTENVNVSTVCILADGKIFLNARDNHGYRFLEIRKTSD